MTTTNTAATATATDRDALPYAYPMHTTDALARLDMPLRHAIDRVTWFGWAPTPTLRAPADLAAAIGYCLRVRGVSVFAAIALADVAFADVDEMTDREMTAAVWRGTKRAEQHAAQTLDVEVTHVSVLRAKHPGARWTAKVYLRPVAPTTATPIETHYACAVLDDTERPTAELRALLDTFGADGGPVLDLEREHPLVLQRGNRLDSRRARAITRDEMSATTHLLRADGY